MTSMSDPNATKRICKNCRWVAQAARRMLYTDGERIEDFYECRRYPPRYAGWPTVEGEGWCGEYHPPYDP